MSLISRPSLPKRVFVTSDAIGGVWNYTLELTRYLSAHNFDVRICVLGPAPEPRQISAGLLAGASSVDASGLPLEWTANSEEELDAVASELQMRALQWGADLVHLNAPAQAGIRRWPLPVTVTVHSCVATWWAAAGSGPIPPDLAWRARRTGMGLMLADAIIAPSQSFARELASVYGEGIPVQTVHNGRARRGDRRRASHPGIIFTAGRLWDAGKNVRLIGEAASISGEMIYAAGPPRGPNGETADISRLSLLGSLDPEGMDLWYRRTAIFVSMSRYEPFGLAVLEAAQAGAALVLSDIPTFRELWDGAAVFVDPQNADDLAKTILYLKRSPDLAEKAAAAKARAERYSVAAMGSRTVEIYEGALPARRPTRTVERARA